eukprot:5666424-Pyramimonas_sp.AAC.1
MGPPRQPTPAPRWLRTLRIAECVPRVPKTSSRCPRGGLDGTAILPKYQGKPTLVRWASGPRDCLQDPPGPSLGL